MAIKVTFNGTEYDSLEAMPPEVRQAYERALEMAQKGSSGGGQTPRINVKFSTRFRFVHDGKTYNSIDEMPPDVRQKYAAAMQKIDKDQNGVPDFLEGGTDSAADSQLSMNDPFSTTTPTPIAPLSPQPPVITPDRPNTTVIWVAGLIIAVLLLVILGLALYIMQH
jgi:hypothetical protein